MTAETERPTLLVQTDDAGNFPIPDELWEGSILDQHERFDLLVRDDGVLKIRVCPHDEDALRARRPSHDGDPEWTEASWCGLVKWVCAGCGRAQIVEHEDVFPDRWLEISQLSSGLETLGTAAVCSVPCLVLFVDNGAPLPPWRRPGFAPVSGEVVGHDPDGDSTDEVGTEEDSSRAGEAK